MLTSKVRWTNRSVRALSAGPDPVTEIIDQVKRVVLEASALGIKGPPYDPFEIARCMGVETAPKHDVPDARVIGSPGGKFLIEYNPMKPRGLIRVSARLKKTRFLCWKIGNR